MHENKFGMSPLWGTPTEEPTAVLTTSQARRRLAIPALAVLGIYLFTILAQEVLLLLVARFAPALRDADWFMLVAGNTPMYLVGMPLSLIVFGFSFPEPPKPKRIAFPVFLGLIAICFSLTIVGNIVSNVINTLLEAITGKPPVNDLAELTLNTPLWANLLFVGILAPVLEEIFFRKLVIDRWRQFGELPAILLSGLLFGLIHGNVSQVFYAAMIGMVFGYIYLRTGRLRYTIALHMIINMIGGVYSSEMLKLFDMEALESGSVAALLQNMTPMLMMMAYLFFLVLCFIGAPIALVLLWRRIRFEKAPYRLTAEQWLRALLLNPAIWLLLAFIGFMFAV
ncbi:MAG: CPBP family intramembrane metalloprotease [Ruminococcaceae bacterium]|nr:CPBP family intramembrane metalloprotease [Oscillospiraceae bacterium]